MKLGAGAGGGLGAGTITLCRTLLGGTVILVPVIPAIEPVPKGDTVRGLGIGRLGIELNLEKPGFPCGIPADIRAGRKPGV